MVGDSIVFYMCYYMLEVALRLLKLTKSIISLKALSDGRVKISSYLNNSSITSSELLFLDL